MARAATASADTPQRMLDIAERLVQTRGFNGFSYADIAAALGGHQGEPPLPLPDQGRPRQVA